MKFFQESATSATSSVVVIEVFEHQMQLLMLSLRHEPDAYRMSRSMSLPGSFQTPDEVLEGLRRLRLDRFSAYPVILLLHSKLVSTVLSSAVVMRRDPSSPISEAEIENLIATSLWKLLSKERAPTALKLGIAETDVVVASAAIVGVKLDKHRVQNPAGFKAHAVELECWYHCCSAGFLKEVEKIISEERLIMVAEIGASEAWFAGKTNFLFFEVGQEATALFLTTDGETRYYDSIPWGSSRVTLAMAESFLVSSAVAQRMLSIRDSKEASAFFLKKFEELIQGEVSLLWKGIASHLNAMDIAEWMYCTLEPLPSNTETKNILRRSGIEVMGEKVDESAVGNRTGFHLQLDGTSHKVSLVPVLAALKTAQMFLHGSALTKIAMRRARWLQPSGPTAPK